MLRLHQIFILATLYLNFGLFEGLPITNDTQREILRKLYQRLRVDVEDFGLALNFTSNESEMRLGTSSDGWSFRKVVDAIVGRKEEEAEQVNKNGVSETINDIIHNLNEVREMVEGSNCTGGEPEPHASEETDEHEDDHEDEHEHDHEDEHEVDSHEEDSHEDEEHSEEDSHSGSEEESEEHHQSGTEISTHGSEEAAVEITTATEGSSESLTTTEWPFRATFHEIGAHLGLLKIVPRPAATEEEFASTTESVVTTAIYDFVDKLKSSLGYQSNTSEENTSDTSAEQINSPSDVVLSTEEPVESETNVAAELEGAAEMTTLVSETESEGHSNEQHVTSARGGTAGEETHSTSDELTQGSDSPGESSKEIALPAIDVAGQEDESYEIQEAATSETPVLESIDPDQLGNEQASSRLSISIEDSKNDAENQSSKDIEAINVILSGETSVTDAPDSSTMSSNAIDDSLKISDSPQNLDQSTETAGKSLEKEIPDEKIAEKSEEENTAGKSTDEEKFETTTEISAVNSSDQDDIKSMSQENIKQISPPEALPEDASATTVPTDSSDDGSSEIGAELETIVEETESDMERENKMNNFSGEILTPEIIQAEIERAAQQKAKKSGEEDKSAENEADLIDSNSKEDNFSGEILTPEIILAEKVRAAQEKVNQSDDDPAKRDEILETKSDADNVEQNKFTTEIIPPAGEGDKIEATIAESYGGRDINDDLILVEAGDEQTSTAEPKFTTEMPPEEVDDISTDLNSRRVITHSEEMEYLEKTQTQEKGSYSDEIEEAIYGSTVVVNETVPERVKDVFEELLEMQKAQERENETDNKSAESTFGKISTWIEEKLDETHEQSKNDSDDGIFGGIISEASSVAEKARDAIDELFEMKKSHEEEKAPQNSAERETEERQGAYDSFFTKLITDSEKSQEDNSTPTSELTDQIENAGSEHIATHAPVQEGSEESKTVQGIEKEPGGKKQEEDKILTGSGEIPKSEEGGGFGSWFKQVNKALQNENEAQEMNKVPVNFDDRSKEIKIAPRTEKDDESTQKEDLPTKDKEDESVKEPNESASKSEGGFGTWFKHVNEALQNENQDNAEEGSSNASVKQDGSEAEEVKLSKETENDVVRSDNESVGSETKEPNESASKSEGGGFGTWFKHVNEALQNEKGTEEESTSTHATQDGTGPSTESGKEAEILGSISEEKDEVNISGKQEKDTGHSDSSKSENKSEGGFGTWFKHVNEALQNENQDKKEEESSNASVKQEYGSEAEDAKLSNEAENYEKKSESEMHLAKGEEEQSAGSGTKEPNEIAGKKEGSGFGTWFKQALQNEKDADEESTSASVIHGQPKETKSSNETGKEIGILDSRSEEKDLLNVIGKEESEHSDKSKSENKSEGGFGSWFKHVAETLENDTKSIIGKLDSGEREHAEKVTEAPSSVETTQASILEESEEKSSFLSAITAGVDSAVDKVSSWFGEKLHEKEESSEPEGGSGLGGKISAAEKAYERESETEEQTLEKEEEVVAGTTEIGKGEKSKVTSADTKETSSSEDKKLTVDFATDVIHSAEKESEDKIVKSDEAKENAPVKLGDDSADTDNKAAVIPDTQSNENENIPSYDEISAGNVPDANKESDDVESKNEENMENIDQADTEEKIELAPAPAEKDDSNEGGLVPQVESGEKPEEHTPEHVPEYESPTIELEQTDLDDYNEPLIDVEKLEEEEEVPAGGTEMKQPVVAETENVKYEHNLSSNLISPGTDRVEPSMLSMKQFHDNKGNPEPRVNVTFNAPKDKGVYDMYIDRKGRRCSEFTELPLDVEYLREVFVNFGFSNFQLPSLGVNLNELADKAVFFKDLDDNSILCGTLTINHR